MSAVDRAPGVTAYRITAVSLLDAAAFDGVPLDTRRELLESSVAVLLDGLDRSPLSLELNARLASQRKRLMDLDGERREAETIAAFEHTVELLPNHWQPKRNLGIVLRVADRPANSVAVLDDALELVGDAPSPAEVLLQQAFALEDLGRNADAIDVLHTALDRLPKPKLAEVISEEIRRLEAGVRGG